MRQRKISDFTYGMINRFYVEERELDNKTVTIDTERSEGRKENNAVLGAVETKHTRT
jgi:hypothetical protein